MADQIEEENKITSPQEDQPKMVEDTTKKLEKMNMFSIWPPTQRTRDAVINRLIETLSAPSILTKRYDLIPLDEASEVARRIEEEAFASAGSCVSADDDGIEILQAYSKEISKRMLESVKSRSASSHNTTTTTTAIPPTATEDVPTASVADEDTASAETQS